MSGYLAGENVVVSMTKLDTDDPYHVASLACLVGCCTLYIVVKYIIPHRLILAGLGSITITVPIKLSITITIIRLRLQLLLYHGNDSRLFFYGMYTYSIIMHD